MNIGSWRQILVLGEHRGEGLCTCIVDEHGHLDATEDEDGQTIIRPECPVSRHSGPVHQVEFSDDGAQVMSAGNEVFVWDIASGRRVRQLAGEWYALVHGLSQEHKWGRHVLTARGDTLLIYECGKELQHGGEAAPVACFKAPSPILAVRCHGAAICVGGVDGAVCILSAPFLAA